MDCGKAHARESPRTGGMDPRWSLQRLGENGTAMKGLLTHAAWRGHRIGQRHSTQEVSHLPGDSVRSAAMKSLHPVPLNGLVAVRAYGALSAGTPRQQNSPKQSFGVADYEWDHRLKKPRRAGCRGL